MDVTSSRGGVDRLREVCKRYSLEVFYILKGYWPYIHICKTGSGLRLLKSFAVSEVESMTKDQMEMAVAEVALDYVGSRGKIRKSKIVKLKEICERYSLIGLYSGPGYRDSFLICTNDHGLRVAKELSAFDVECMTDDQMEMAVAEVALGEVVAAI